MDLDTVMTGSTTRAKSVNSYRYVLMYWSLFSTITKAGKFDVAQFWTLKIQR